MIRRAPVPERGSDPTQKAWVASLGGGVVVAGAVWTLLEVLRRTVNDVDEAVTRVWTSGKNVAQNTQTAHLLETTKQRGAELVQELERHAGPSGGGAP